MQYFLRALLVFTIVFLVPALIAFLPLYRRSRLASQPVASDAPDTYLMLANEQAPDADLRRLMDAWRNEAMHSKPVLMVSDGGQSVDTAGTDGYDFRPGRDVPGLVSEPL